jgi:hypothetical protein
MDRNPQPGDRRRAAPGGLKRKARLRLVTDTDPGSGSVFDNLDTYAGNYRGSRPDARDRARPLRGYRMPGASSWGAGT